MMYDGDHMNGWGWAFMTVGSVLLWAVLIFAVVILIRHFTGSRPISFGNRPSPEDVLAQRFARGEIDEADYRQRLAVLAEQRQTPSHSGNHAS
jgi:putative membrane protein